VSSIIDAAIARAVEHWADAKASTGGAPSLGYSVEHRRLQCGEAANPRRKPCRPGQPRARMQPTGPVSVPARAANRAHRSARGQSCVGSLIARGTTIGRAPSSPEMAPKFRRGGVLSRAMRLLEDEAKSAMPVSTDCYSIKECAIRLIDSESRRIFCSVKRY